MYLHLHVLMNPTVFFYIAAFVLSSSTLSSHSTAFLIPKIKFTSNRPKATTIFHSYRPPTTDIMNSNNDNDAGAGAYTRADANPKPLLRNFRKAAGLSKIYRCASTDVLGTSFPNDALDIPSPATTPATEIPPGSPEATVLSTVGLVLDLRSPTERDETLARRWTSLAPGGPFSVHRHERGPSARPPPVPDYGGRTVLRIDVLDPKRLFDYCGRNWIGPEDRAGYAWNCVFDTRAAHATRMDAINEKGLVGLYRAVVETAGEELRRALVAITEYFEASFGRTGDAGGVVVHCVQGKDRTGLVVMLCQSILDVEDETIIEDYFMSNAMESGGKRGEGSAAAAVVETEGVERGKLSREIFKGAPREAMVMTLGYLRETYGSVYGYLDFIGFDADWRTRFLAAQRRVCKEQDVLLQSKL